MRKKMEQILLEDGELFTAASGISMLPCIRPQKDILHLVRPEGIVENSEVILYRRKNGSYILHRVIGRDTVECFIKRRHPPESGITVIFNASHARTTSIDKHRLYDRR